MRYLTPILVFLLVGTAGACVRAQTTPQSTISQLFAGMYAGDSTGMHALFAPGATLQTAAEAGVKDSEVENWLSFLHGKPAGQLDEQLHYTEIRRSGSMATAWTPYNFVYDGKISHCGVNAFTLIETDGVWKIFRVIDTRLQDCPPSVNEPVAAIDSLADRWHRAASDADSAAYFGLMTDDAIFIGTDKTEHWNKDEFLAYAAPYFARGKAWSFTAAERHVFYDPNHQVAYWDEVLNTRFGPCRGTGVAKRDGPDGWKIAHYTLSVTVDNDQMDAFIELTKD